MVSGMACAPHMSLCVPYLLLDYLCDFAYKYQSLRFSRHSQVQENFLSSDLFSVSSFSYSTTMSTCGDCDCADKSQCVKKGNSYGIEIVETQKSYYEDAIVEVAAAAEHDGKCKCGAGCTCTDCTCGH